MNNKQTKKIPLVPLRGILVFPYMITHLDIGREMSMKSLEESLIRERLIVLVTQKDALQEEPDIDDLFPMGTVAEVKQVLKLPGGVVRVLVEGLHRGQIFSLVEDQSWIEAEIVELPEEKIPRTPQVEALVRNAVHNFEQWVKLSKKVSPETMLSVVMVDEPGRLSDLIAGHMTLKVEDKQLLLDAYDVKERLERLCTILSQEMEILELEKKINVQVRKQMEKNQKEYYLREQLKAINKELGDKDERLVEMDEYRKRLAEQDYPEAVVERINKELERLDKMPPMSAEGSVIRTYVDCLLALPWSILTEDRLDVNQAEKVLEEDHYGLDKVKERILEYLAVRQLTNNSKGSIICLVGPPGVGKTSLARSVARALERKFIRMSLGGVRDEAEIRGHRRTYIGALPGRIIQGMRTAGSRNPVFLLDEIDKMSADFRGDPSAALLEVLDSEQNNTFSDHYLELPYDLSKVLWILTANTTHNVPSALLDRMEVINIPGYTEEEKQQIASRYLIRKQLNEHGLDAGRVAFSDEVVIQIIREYTREAGVRNLERSLAAICRKVARRIIQHGRKRVRLTAKNLSDYLGIAKYRHNDAEKENQVGVATGLAVTSTGGDVLPVEVAIMPGKGTLNLTGHLGEVMQESAKAGFAYIRARAKSLGLADDFYEKSDIHVHIPQGAIPKDGPSAGITMAAAILSALTNRPLRADTAMTGEITLRGRVMPVGGIKEKVLAAHRLTIRRVILPDDNRRDLEDLPVNVRKDMVFVPVQHMDEVLKAILVESGDLSVANNGS